MGRLQNLLISGAFALGASACGEAPDAFCAGLDTVIAAAGNPVPFETLRIDPKTGEPFGQIPPPGGMEDAVACVAEPGLKFSVFECRWLSSSIDRPAGETMIADKVRACLTPKGWVMDMPSVEPGVELRLFHRVGLAADVGVVSTGLGGIQRDSVMVRVPLGN